MFGLGLQELAVIALIFLVLLAWVPLLARSPARNWLMRRAERRLFDDNAKPHGSESQKAHTWRWSRNLGPFLTASLMMGALHGLALDIKFVSTAAFNIISFATWILAPLVLARALYM